MNTYKMDFAAKTLTITKAFAEAASNPSSEEYAIMMKFHQDFPGLKIARKTHRTPTRYKTKSGETYSCNQFKNLTYENMEAFMNAIPNSEKYMALYNFLRHSVGGIQINTYAAVRSWFVAQFPYYRKDPVFYLTNDVDVIDITPFLQKQQEKQGA